MSDILDKALKALEQAESELDSFGLGGGDSMFDSLIARAVSGSRALAVDEVAFAEGLAKALLGWAAAKRQYAEAKRVATWNPETGWKRVRS